MRKLSLVLLLLLPAFVFSADEAKPRPLSAIAMEKPFDVAGYYRVAGTANNEPYGGMALVERIGDVYRVQYLSGSSPVIGIGIRIGDELVISWQLTDKSGIGVTRYRIQPAGKLIGIWASMPGNGRIENETMEWLAPSSEQDEPADANNN